MKTHKEREKELALPLSTKVIILFDNDLLANTYRVYELSERMSGQLKLGRKIGISFRHPDVGEEFAAELLQ